MFSDPNKSLVVKLFKQMAKDRGVQAQAERTKSRKEKQKRKQRLTLLRGSRRYRDVT
jgi:hypothetical protein